VEGRVQGVNFRYFVTQQAGRLGLSGWVRNRLDGTVELVAEGKREHLDDLLSALHEGPPAANVTAVHPKWLRGTGEFGRFQVRMTR